MLALLGLRDAIAAAAGASLMFIVWGFFDKIDDARVAREARKEYVAISELAAEKARVRTAEALIEAERKRLAEIEEDRQAFAEALGIAQAQLSIARQSQEDYQNEIEKLLLAKPSGVPTVNELGVRLRNR